MSTATIVIFVIAIAIVAVIAVRSGGPRITQITRRREEDEGEKGE